MKIDVFFESTLKLQISNIYSGLFTLLNEEDEAPDFTLTADDGKKISLKDYRGKKIVLYFYPKDNTPGCTTEAIAFRDAINEFDREDSVVIGISKDSIQSHRKFREKYKLPFILLSDPEAKILKLYGVWKRKNMYGKIFMGTERSTFLIDEKGIIKKIYRKVKVKGHVGSCLIDIKNL